jgi:hypothetical protein
VRPETEAAIVGIADLFKEKLAACEALRDFGLEVANPWRGRLLGEDGATILAVDKIVAGLFVRATNTNWAALELCRIGFGEKALMLQRSQFEDLADAHWATVADGEIVVKLFKAHEEHEHMLLGEAATKHPEIFEVSELPTFDEIRRDELDNEFGRYGDKSWTKLNIHKRVEAIEHLWPEGEERDQLQFFRRIVQRLANSALHVSAYALSSITRGEDDEGISYLAGPTAQGVEGALFNSNWMYTQMLRLLLRHFDFPEADGDRLESLYVDGRALFATLTDDDLRGVGRNDQCPCGSGKKFKRCHGA